MCSEITNQARIFAVAIAVIDFVLAIIAFAAYNTSAGGIQLVDRFSNWIPGLGDDGFAVQYLLGIDGLSAPLVLLTGLLGLVAVLASWHIKLRVREYFIWLLALQTGVSGRLHLAGLPALLPLLGA